MSENYLFNFIKFISTELIKNPNEASINYRKNNKILYRIEFYFTYFPAITNSVLLIFIIVKFIRL